MTEASAGARTFVTLRDCTLREGRDVPGVAFTSEQAVAIATLLAEARVPELEVIAPAHIEADVAWAARLRAFGLGVRVSGLVYAAGADCRAHLAAVARTGAVRPCWLAPLLLPASALSVAVSVVVPVWILTLVLRSFLGSDWLSLAFSLLLTSSACLASGGLTLALLARQRAGSPAPAPSGALFLETHHE